MSEEFTERLMINSDIRLLKVAREFISRLVKLSKLNPAEENKIVLAVDEALSNSIEHAYENKKVGSIDIHVASSRERFQVEITNGGKIFDSDKVKIPDILKCIRSRQKGGLGIFLIRQVMDEVKYSSKDGQNHLVLVKYKAKS
ncbi:MAG: ATP-binding protein [Candidatus Brocadiia bacterium]